MNKKTKLMLVLLSAATVTASAFGLAACGGGAKETTDATYYAEYQTYVEGRKKAKEDYLGYQEWLSIKLFQEADGNTGTNGTDGATWLTGTTAPAATSGKDGDFYINTADFKVYNKVSGAWTELGSIKGSDGEEGVGVESVTYENDKLVVKLSNGETKEVDLPEHITHKHAYNDEDVVTLVEPGADSDGVGYKVCTADGCEHIELVVLTKRYIVKVVNLLGEPVAGAEIKINGVVETTDAQGVASIYGYGYKNDYVIGVKKEGLVVASDCRTEDKPLIEITMASKLTQKEVYDADANDGEGGYVPADAITEAGVYAVTMSTADVMYYPAVSSAFVLAPEGAHKKFRVTPSTDIVTVLKENNPYGDTLTTNGNVLEKLVVDGDVLPFWFGYDEMKLTQSGMQKGDMLTFIIVVEELELPEAGTEELPIFVTPGEDITIPAGTTEPVYYAFKNTSEKVDKVKLDLAGVTATFNSWTNSWGTLKEDAPAAVTSGNEITLVSDPEGYGNPEDVIRTYNFVVTPEAGAPEQKFKFSAIYQEGTKENPAEITLGTPFEKVVSGKQKLFCAKLVVETEGDYSFILDGCQFIGVVKDINVLFQEEEPAAEDIVAIFNGASDKVHLEAGTYYLGLVGSFDYYSQETDFSCTVRAFNQATDAGILASTPKELTLTFTENVATFDTLEVMPNTVTYYEYTATQAGVLSVSTGSQNQQVSVVGSIEELMTPGDYTSKTVAVGDKVLMVATQLDPYDEIGSATQFTVTVSIGEAAVVPEGVDHTITVKTDAATPVPVEGVTVTVSKFTRRGGTEVVATGLTDADGVLKVDGVLPKLQKDNYLVEVSGYDKADYLFDNAVSFNSNDSQSIDVTLRSEKKSWDFVVKTADGEETEKIFNGATVQLYNGEDKVAEGVVESGKVTLSAIMPNDALAIKVTLPDADAENYQLPVDANNIITSLNENSGSIIVEVLSKKDYSVVINDVAGLPAAGITVNLTAGGEVLGTAVTTAGGKVTFKAVPYENYLLTFENIPEKTCLSDFKLTETEFDYTLRLSTGDKLVNGVTNEMIATRPSQEGKDNALIVGYNAITNDAALNYYTFTAEKSAMYTLSISDNSGKAYISSLKIGRGSLIDTELISNGKVQTADIVLGANRGMNKAYEATLEIKAGQTIVIGYATDTGMRGNGFVTVTQGELTAVDLRVGTNNVELTNGKATCIFSYSQSEYTDPDYAISWEGTGVTLTDKFGTVYNSGDTLRADTEYTVVINVDASVPSVDLVIAPVEQEEGPGDR